MKIRAGYEIEYDCPQPTPMILQLSVHPSRTPDLLSWDRVKFDPPLPANTYHDNFGNFCHVITAPKGRLKMTTDFIVRDSGEPDPVVPDAEQHALKDLPVDTLVYLLGSRYCETDRMSNTAWSMFGDHPKGWPLVQAICDYAHNRIKFGYQDADPTMSAFEVHNKKKGVCRDYAHLAITLCRAMNIPARYCTGYLGDIGMPPPYPPGDFAAWFEAYLGGRWYTFDPRNNMPRIGRILMARGRDATDVAIVTSFGSGRLDNFKVITDEVVETDARATA
ncbi:MAG: transglutaminase family protein [Pseudolabrys sp.]|nr:transglutaminase family protein [Pseudolabrys sp.]